MSAVTAVNAAPEEQLTPRQRSGPAPRAAIPAPAAYGARRSIAAGSAADLHAEPAEEAGQVDPLGAGWIIVTVVIGVMAALIAIGGMVLSFRAVSVEMVPAFGARWSWLVPIVVDMTVFVFSGVDLVLARLDMSHPLARWTVYVATAGTVVLNYSAGGNLAGRVAHVLMPSIWVVFIELMRHVVRRQVNLATSSHREPIPAARWALSPWPTLKLWRRMVLWRVNSYPRALDQEKLRLGAVATARETYGVFWRFRISPLVRLQINLGEVGAADLRPDLVRPGAAPAGYEPSASERTAAAHIPTEDSSFTGAAPFPGRRDELAAATRTNGTGNDRAGAHRLNGTAAPEAPRTVAAPRADTDASGAVPIPAAFHEAFAGSGRAAFAHSPAPVRADGGRVDTGRSDAGRTDADSTAEGSADGGSALTDTAEMRALARLIEVTTTPPAHGYGEAPADWDGSEAAAARVNGAETAQRVNGNGVPLAEPVTRVNGRGAHAARPAVDPTGGAAVRPDAPGPVDFQAPPLPRRSVRESELLTAAREVERWRGQPSATRISRELGIGMPLAISLANALRDEDGPVEQ